MLQFVRPESKYIKSHWEALDEICKEGAYLGADQAFPLESTIEFVTKIIEKDIPQLLVIDTETDRCVGWCDAVPKEADPTIGCIGTGLLKSYREQGIGTRLLQDVIALARQYGYQKLELDVRALNKRAIHVYEKLGFTAYNVLKDGYTSTDKRIVEDVIQMELQLT